jgi:hypothetical protein
MDLGRSKQYTFHSFKKKVGQKYFFLAIFLQTVAEAHEYVRVRKCQRAYVI